MAFTLPKELLESEWKSHKANLATGTGIGDELKKLAGLAKAYDYTDDTKSDALRKALTKFSATAKTAQGKMAAVFPKTKAYLGLMSTVATSTVAKIVKDEKQLRDNDRAKAETAKAVKAAGEKRMKRLKALEDLRNLTDKPDKFVELLEKNRDVLDVTLGSIIKTKKALREKDKDALVEIFAELEFPVGQALKLIQSVKAK